MSPSLNDLPRLETVIAQSQGRERWLLEVARLQLLMPEGIPIEVLAHDWGISEDEAEARLIEINTLGDEPLIEGEPQP